MTHRQYLVWQEWQQLEWNRPDRHDWYAMQTAGCMVGRRTEAMKIPFVFDRNYLQPFQMVDAEGNPIPGGPRLVSSGDVDRLRQRGFLGGTLPENN